MNLSIFENIDQYPSTVCQDYKSCIAIKRLSSALSYYSTLNIQNNQHDQELFTKFVQEIYRHTLLIQDLYHFQKQHDNKLHEMRKYTKSVILIHVNIPHDTIEYQITMIPPI